MMVVSCLLCPAPRSLVSPCAVVGLTMLLSYTINKMVTSCMSKRNDEWHAVGHITSNSSRVDIFLASIMCMEHAP